MLRNGSMEEDLGKTASKVGVIRRVDMESRGCCSAGTAKRIDTRVEGHGDTRWICRRAEKQLKRTSVC